MIAVLLIHIAATLFMTGLIWFVQVNHYPLFASVGQEGFAAYERLHQRRTTWVVAPVMLAELVSGLALLLRPPAGVPPGVVVAGAVLLALIWLSTAALQVPQHRRLERGFDVAAHHALCRTNWIRTAAWTVRCLLVLWMAGRVMREVAA